MKTIQSVSKEMLDNLTTSKRDDGSEYVKVKEIIAWQTDIFMKAHEDRAPDDYIYEFIQDALYVFVEIDEDEKDEDIFREAIYEIEADVYTSQLTAWLGSSNYNIYYLTEAIEQCQPEDGFALLSAAQQLHKQEVAGALLSAIISYIEDSK